MKKRLIIIFSVMLLLCVGAFFACDSCKKDSDKEPEPTVATLKFTENNISVFPNETKVLSVTGLEEGESVIYSSNDEKVVTVDDNGTIKGVATGSAVVKATSSKGRSALVAVTVENPNFYPVPTISVEKTSINLYVGDKYTISPVIYYLGEEIKGDITYLSQDTTVLTVSDGTVNAIKSGETFVTITASTSYGETAKKITFKVAEKQTEFITSLAGGVAYLGRQIELVAYVRENGTVKEIDGANFVSANENILKIENEYAEPVLGGDTTVTVTFTYGSENLTITQEMHVYGYVSLKDLKQDETLCDAVTSATMGSYAQAQAICDYLTFIETLTDREKASDSQIITNVSKVNAIMDIYFSDGLELTFSNKTAVSTEYSGAGYQEGGNGPHHSGYTTEKLKSANGTKFYLISNIYGSGATVTLPAMAYSDYEEVVFGFFCYKMPGDSTFSIGNQSYTNSGNNEYNGYYKVLIKNGVLKLYDESNNAVLITLTLNSTVLDGSEGLTFVMNANCYMVEFTTVYAKKSAEKITINGKTPIDSELTEPVLYNAITSATNGSEAQYLAIEKYREFHNSLTTEQKADATHTANVAAINNIIDTNFANGFEAVLANKPIVSGCRADAPLGPYYGAGWEGTIYAQTHHSAYTTEKLRYTNGTGYYVSVVETAGTTGIFTLPTIAYSYYDEVIFGFYFITGAGTTTINIGGKTFTLSASDGNWFGRVVIKGGVLTVYKDDTNAVMLTVNLSADVLSGSTGLVISATVGGWSQIEFTTVYAKKTVAKLN